jgi:predicted amidohydrolase
LYRHYFLKGANLLTVASAFTVPTGMAHWETLLRARAIENQSYVVACNQYGTHNDKIKTYGHSLVISPWGKVLVDLGEGEGVATIELELSEVEKVRSRLYVKPTLMNLD